MVISYRFYSEIKEFNCKIVSKGYSTLDLDQKTRHKVYITFFLQKISKYLSNQKDEDLFELAIFLYNPDTCKIIENEIFQKFDSVLSKIVIFV